MRDIQVRSMEKVCVFICSVFFSFKFAERIFDIFFLKWFLFLSKAIWFTGSIENFKYCTSFGMFTNSYAIAIQWKFFLFFFYVSYSTPMRFLSRVCKFNQDFYFFSLSLSFNIFHKRINWNTINTIKKRKWTGRK